MYVISSEKMYKTLHFRTRFLNISQEIFLFTAFAVWGRTCTADVNSHPPNLCYPPPKAPPYSPARPLPTIDPVSHSWQFIPPTPFLPSSWDLNLAKGEHNENLLNFPGLFLNWIFHKLLLESSDYFIENLNNV